MSAFSLLLGLLGFYAVLHYVPAQLSPSTLLRDSNMTSADLRAERTGAMRVLGPYWDALQLRSSYVWEGETLEVRYALDVGQTTELVISRCQRAWVLEIVHCTPIEQSRVVVDHTTQRKIIHVARPGYYEFRETTVTGERPRVVWRRLD
ncbi:MAG: hypothetical protein WBF53_06485 [Litorimonas sp.]